MRAKTDVRITVKTGKDEFHIKAGDLIKNNNLLRSSISTL